MEGKKQTAVEWLVSILNKEGFYPVLTDEEIEKAKQVESEEKIKAKIEAVNHFCKLNGFAGTDRHKAVILMYEQQLK